MVSFWQLADGGQIIVWNKTSHVLFPHETNYRD
uniref:Uncharacterized protein n=1 Tax=Physcomitrium patens TaxID=3218 RepID=A0A7I4B4A9_PHYPA